MPFAKNHLREAAPAVGCLGRPTVGTVSRIPSAVPEEAEVPPARSLVAAHTRTPGIGQLGPLAGGRRIGVVDTDVLP
jgi:hypothetical protein